MPRPPTLLLLCVLLAASLFPVPAVPANAQSVSLPDLMENLIVRVTSIETACNPSLGGSIARTRRLEILAESVPVLESIAESAEDGELRERFLTLLQTAREGDANSEIFRPVLSELWTLATVIQCEAGGIGASEVAQYVKSASSTFVADRGSFFHPGFDTSTLSAQDYVRIYFAGFGLVVLLQMEGGIEQAVELYRNSTELRPYFAQQLVFRGADFDVEGLPLIETVLSDPAFGPWEREVFFGVLAGKMVGPSGQFGQVLTFSDEWRTAIGRLALEQILLPERLSSRQQAPFYGANLQQKVLGPESLLGLIGPSAESHITALLQSPDVVRQVSGLEAVLWVNEDTWPDYAARLFSMAEPMMMAEDFPAGVLALSVFEKDAVFSGSPYDEARRERLQRSLPAFCALMQRALANPDIDYLSSSAWLDLAAEGSLLEQLECCVPMVARVIRADWARRRAGHDVPFPEAEVNLVAHFASRNPALIEEVSEAVLGFLTSELETGVNPFRVWAYVHFAQAMVAQGFPLDGSWHDAILRLRQWAESAHALVSGEELKLRLDQLLHESESDSVH